MDDWWEPPEGYKFINWECRCDIEQYRLLKRCSDIGDLTEWNKWREQYPDAKIVLQGANLNGFYLLEANLREARLEFAHCEGANFTYAHCEGANFIGAHCEEANFRHAHCEEANFRHAHCEKAIFASAHCKGANFWGAHCEEADFVKAHCKGAIFWAAHCEEADFVKAHCKGAIFWTAHCEGASFETAHCEGANFERAHCEGANFIGAHCEKADFEKADCEGTDYSNSTLTGTVFRNVVLSNRTCFIACAIDDNTDFSNSSLDSVIIEPGKKAKLEQNIRRKNWQGWFRDVRTNENMGNGLVLDGVKAWVDFLCAPAVRFFWYLSDYGYSTKRVLCWFFVFIFFFAITYTIEPSMLGVGGGNVTERNFLQMLAFSTSTMVTLGFSNINVALIDGKPDELGMLVVTLNLMVGYFMLAVLVTRLAILFQTLGPGHVVNSNKRKNHENLHPDKRLSPCPGHAVVRITASC